MKRTHVILLVAGIIFIILGILTNKSLNSPKISKSSPSIKNQKEKNKTLTGKETVEEVLDGDTIKLSSGEKIRYIGINTPEKGQPYAKEAAELNKSLVLNKEVKLEFDVQTKDRYGRTLAYVYAGDIFVNLEIVKNGLGVSETIQPNVKYQDEFVNAQKSAREKCLELWEGLCEGKPSGVLGSESNKCVKITSITADAPGDDNKNKNGEWVEIKSSCSVSASMKDWLLKDSSASNEYHFKEFTLDAGKSVFIYSGCGQDSKEKLYWECPERKYAVWNNSTDHAFLYNEKGELISDYQY
ncbi:MAG: thermonuclease family protein [Patescibacteria group bacterium]|nr:thermonuclease family protein [Patescibacteria group bacterium]